MDFQTVGLMRVILKTLLHRNCSGWDRKIYIDNKNDMINMIKGYDYKMGDVNRTLAEKHLSSISMVNSFEKVVYGLVRNYLTFTLIMS